MFRQIMLNELARADKPNLAFIAVMVLFNFMVIQDIRGGEIGIVVIGAYVADIVGL